MKTAIALGTFDGVHIGHREVLNLPPDCLKVAVTFKKPPKTYIAGETGLLMTTDDKCEFLRKIGINDILVLSFTVVKNMEPQEFLDYLRQKYDLSLISCGFNYRFGKNGSGDVEFLRSYCEDNGIVFRCCDPVKIDGNAVSSTDIRKLIKDAQFDKAARLLGHPFSFNADVIQGDARGRTIGFPTINQRYPQELVELKFGVYKTEIGFDNMKFEGITNIGVRPTFQTDYVISETYIKDFSGDLYGKNIRITPLKYLREEKKFSSLEELQKQITVDLNS